jgi:hypothetical protein
MKTCNLCGQVEGEITLDGSKIMVEGYGVCNKCRNEIASLGENYREDYENRTGQKIEKIIPWPAFKEFSWPPHADVLLSGWELKTCEFAIAMTETSLVSGRRSIASMEDDVTRRISELSKAIEESKDYGERTKLRRDFDRYKRKMEKVEDLAKAGERKLFIISIDKIVGIETEKRGDWVHVSFKERKIKTGFFGGKKEITVPQRWIVTALYEDTINALVKRVREKTPQ